MPPRVPLAVRLAGAESSMTLRELRRMALLGLVVFVALLEVTRHMLYQYLDTAVGHLLMDGVVVVGALFFFGAVFQLIGQLERKLARQNEELLALHRAGLDIHGELALDVVLQKVVDRAAHLLDARYGAISVIDEAGRIDSFVTTGITPEERARLGDPPRGHGVLGIALHEGHRLRLADLTQHPRSYGFPPHHPHMRSLLAVPVPSKGGIRANLYLAEKRGAPEFSPSDEETLVRFATQAAIAIDNAQLHQRLRALAVAEERLRIAHDMHDGLAQVLAYVNTKAQAVKEFLRAGKAETAGAQLEELAAAAREVYADVREGIVNLREAQQPDRTLAESLQAYVDDWQDRSGIRAELAADSELGLPVAAEVQLARIVQEALTNVRKHARARSVRVKIRREADRVLLAVTDDGVGFDPAQPRAGEFPRFGLTTMRERAEGVGGSIEIDSAPGAGTTVLVELPVTVAPPQRAAAS
ncbi:MAG TPA: GAF domain-containing sensor histidine kinase [Thermoanaerobaculia bacterium]|nr:GAF domain-containing sensor histidine kinase [Thermoanaerobaculia bacterium]